MLILCLKPIFLLGDSKTIAIHLLTVPLMINTSRSRVLLCTLLILCFAHAGFAQTSYTDKVAGWKTQFSKEEMVTAKLKESISFTLNPNPAKGEAAVQATVVTDATLVPLKDFLKYSDGLFYNDEIKIDKVKVTDAASKDVIFQKLCGDYSSDDIFHSDAKLCVVKFPLAEKGKPFYYHYQEDYKDIKFLTSFYFQQQYPIVERIVEFLVPAWLEMDFREFNFDGYGITRSSTKEGDITKTTFTVSNTAAYSRESHSPNHALSNPHIICVAKAYQSNGSRTVLLENVNNLYGWYSSVCAEIGNDPEVLKAKVADLTRDKKTPQEKVESIFYWVQDNIRYIAFENGIMGFKPDAAQNVYKNKYGDCKGMANLLKTMLTLAGFDARLTWIGTSDLPYDYSLPSLVVDNHMICTVILNGKRYFLDGTESYIALNDYAQRIQGKQILIEDGKNHILDRIPEFAADRNKVTTANKITIVGAELKGSSVMDINGESKVSVQQSYSAIKQDKREESLKNYLKSDANMVVANITNSDFTDRQKPLQIKYDFTANNQVTTAGNELYVVMDWEKAFRSLDMPADRKNDYEFSQKYHQVTASELQIPEGYKVDYLPTAFKKSASGWSFEGSYVQKGKSIFYNKTIIIQKAFLKKKDFIDWNNFIADINKFYNDQVVLVKL